MMVVKRGKTGYSQQVKNIELNGPQAYVIPDDWLWQGYLSLERMSSISFTVILSE